MKITRVNYEDTNTVGDPAPDLSDVKLEGRGVEVIVTEYPDGISVTINPSGRNFINAIRTHEVYTSDGQVRISSAHGVTRGINSDGTNGA